MSLKDGEFSVNINGVKHWVKVEGSKNGTTPLIILHGGPGGNHYVFERTAGHILAQSRTVVYYEQRGCGRSEMPKSNEDYSIELLVKDFVQLKKWLGIDKVDLLGYSFGGELALEMAVVIPEEINQLILSGPSLMNTDIQKLTQFTGFMSIASPSLLNEISALLQGGGELDEIHDRIWELAGPDTVDLLLFEDQVIASKNRLLWEESRLNNTGFMMKALRNHPMEVPLPLRLEQVENQTLIITGVFDRNTGVPLSKLIHSHLSNSRLVVFEKSAHFPDLEETDKFVETVLTFLEA